MIVRTPDGCLGTSKSRCGSSPLSPSRCGLVGRLGFWQAPRGHDSQGDINCSCRYKRPSTYVPQPVGGMHLLSWSESASLTGQKQRWAATASPDPACRDISYPWSGIKILAGTPQDQLRTAGCWWEAMTCWVETTTVASCQEGCRPGSHVVRT